MKKVSISAIILSILMLMINSSYALCINAPDANLRKGPGTKYGKSWEVFKYMPFQKVSKSGNWYKVKDIDGDVHWVYEKLVTTKFKCAAVKADKANIRKGPGTGFGTNALSPGLKYDAFKIIQTKGDWVRVEDEFGDTGWIFKKLLWIQ